MAKRGRPRKPTALKVIQGTAQPCRLNPDEPVPEGPLGDPPKNMRSEGKRRWEWIRDSVPWLSTADRGIVELYCTRWVYYQDAQKEVAKFGQVWERERDHYTQMNGALQALNNNEKALIELGAKIGLDPVSRTDIKAPRKPDAKSDNPFAING